MPTAPASTPHKTRFTREKILAAAAKNFRERGYGAVTLREIAKTAGMTTGSLYYHFDSKEDVVREVLIQGHDNCHKAVASAVAAANLGDDHRGILHCAVTAHLESLFGEDNLIPANMQIFSQLPPEMRRPAMPSRKAYEAFWRARLKEAQAAGALRDGVDIDIALPLLFGAVNWTVEWAKRDFTQIDAIADQVVAMIIKPD